MNAQPTLKDLIADKGIEPRLPTVIDASALSAFKACRRKFFWEYVCRRVLRGANPHFVAGGAYADGHDAFRKAYYGQGVSASEALELGAQALIASYGDYEPPADGRPSEVAKSWDRVLDAYLTYYQQYPPHNDHVVPVLWDQPDGTRGVASEFSFATPFLDLSNPDTGEPLLYGGKFDQLVHLCPGAWSGSYTPEVTAAPLYGFDDKTTYQMGPTWASQWKMRSQFLGYTWGMQQLGTKLQGFIVRGAAVQKTQIKHVQTVLSFQSWKIEEWLETTAHTIIELLNCYESGTWVKDFDGACTMYGGCTYVELCDSPHPERWISGSYEERSWSPIQAASL